MALNTKFEAYKIKRELKRSGVPFTFFRNGVNEFGEQDDTVGVQIATIVGLYHEQSVRIEERVGDSSVTRTKKVPVILCMFPEASILQRGDVLVYNGKRYKVIGVANIQEWGIVADINLEVFDNGNGV